MEKSKGLILKFLTCFALLIVAYIPTFKWMVDRWLAAESYYGHGFLIPFVSIFVAWQRRGAIKASRVSTDMRGLAVIAAGLFIHIVCAAIKLYFLSGFSFIFVLYGLLLFFFGKDMVRNLVFPLLFLLAMIPLPLVLVSNITVKLKLIVAEAATFVLNRIGFPSARDGNLIIMPSSHVAIEAPCSGLRSLISLLTLGALFSFAVKVSYLRKTLLFMSSVPIAILTNIVRVTMLATVNDLYGEKIAMGFFHDFSGFMMFGIAFAGLYAVSRVLEKGIKDGEIGK